MLPFVVRPRNPLEVSLTEKQHERMMQLRGQLEQILADGLAEDPVEHAEQIAGVAGVLSEAFADLDMEVVIVGGSAIEIHAPGGYVSADMDIIIERKKRIPFDPRISRMFKRLGFQKKNRHWILGDLWVDIPDVHVDGSVEILRVGAAVFRIIRKEDLLAERVAGFKHWPGGLAYGQQAITLLEALRAELDWERLRQCVEKETALDALEELDALAKRTSEVSTEALQGILDRLRAK